MKDTDKKILDIRDLAELSVMCALMVGGKEVMNALPNIHPVMLILILCVRIYGVKSLYSIIGFVMIELMIYGVSLWTVCYLYTWPLYCIAALPFKENNSRLFWGLYAAAAGLLFGPLSALTTAVLSGWKASIAYWVSGIPYDIIHCISNFVIVYFLVDPLYKLLLKLRIKK